MENSVSKEDQDVGKVKSTFSIADVSVTSCTACHTAGTYNLKHIMISGISITKHHYEISVMCSDRCRDNDHFGPF